MEYFIVDAFADELFSGNPAGVCVTHKPLEPWIMQKIAEENRLPETAFVRRLPDGYELRWFTPSFEIDLCGHATLAAAFVVTGFLEPGAEAVRFLTKSGWLGVERNGKVFELSLPDRTPERVELTKRQRLLLGCRPVETLSSRDLILVLENEQAVLDYAPDYAALRGLEGWLGVVITARGNEADFVSRYFCPESDEEDPVTGSSHCSLIPYWAERLGKTRMTARQLSSRGGALFCEFPDGFVKISGKAVLYAKGELFVRDTPVSRGDGASDE